MSTPLPPLHGRWLRATRAPGRLLHGVPRLEGGALVRCGASGTVRVEIVTADVDFRALRPARLDLRATSAAGHVDIELLRIGTGWARTRSPEELDVLAEACGPANAKAAELLLAQAAHLRSRLGVPEISPMAAMVGPEQTRMGSVVGWMP
jgi:hypothetical protein